MRRRSWLLSGLRIGATVVMLLVRVPLGLLPAAGPLAAQTAKPRSVTGTLAKIQTVCPKSILRVDWCAYLEGDPHCYSIFPDDFTPRLPPLEGQVGRHVELVVNDNDLTNTSDSSDPLCNYSVIQLRLSQGGVAGTYSTTALGEKQFIGISRSDWIIVLVVCVLSIAVIVGWNALMEVRLARAR